MQIRSTTLTHSTHKSRPQSAEVESTEENQRKSGDGWLGAVKDFGVGLKLVSLGQLYRMSEGRQSKKIAKNPPLENESAVTIKDPVVLVPGWTTTREAFDPLADKLLEGGRNGGALVFVQNGDFFYDRNCELKCESQFLEASEPKVFEIVFSDVRLPPHKSALEVGQNLKAVKALTGEDKVDVGAYSMGGLATRVYLDQGGQDIDQALFLGTPHRGAEFASLAHRTLTRDIKWALSFSGLIPKDIPALEWLSPEEHGNEQLRTLNQRWPSQKANLNEVRFAGGTGMPTADGGWWPVTTDGDGLVTSKSAAPPGETAVPLPGQGHSHLNNSAAAYREMKDLFGWLEV